MILFYKDGEISRVRISLDDLPPHRLSKVTSLLISKRNHYKLFHLAKTLMGEQQEYSVLAYSNQHVWLTLTETPGYDNYLGCRVV